MSTTFDATVRTQSGKGASRRARAEGGVPAVIYGPGKPSVSVVLNPKDVVKALSGPKKRNALLTLNVKDAGGKTSARTVMLKELQFHPVKRTPTHLDFLEVDENKPVVVKVPLEAIGKSKAVGQGAKLTLIARTVTLLVKPKDVPEKIIFDVTEEGFGVIRAKQLKVPEGTKLLDSLETPLVSIKIPRGDKEEAAATPDAAAAAPAAGAKAAAGAKGAAPAADAKAAPAAKK